MGEEGHKYCSDNAGQQHSAIGIVPLFARHDAVWSPLLQSTLGSIVKCITNIPAWLEIRHGFDSAPLSSS